MDDAYLENLRVSRGTLKPSFQRDITEYCITLPSSEEFLIFSCDTSDTGASYQLLGLEGSRKVFLKEGEVTKVKIEVTSEDGTTKNYAVSVKRLTSTDTSLSSIDFEPAISLKPEFSPNVHQYSCQVSCDINIIMTKAAAIDNNKNIQYHEKHVLNMGETQIDIKVISVNGLNSQIYTIFINKSPLLHAITFVDPLQALQYECPICIGYLHNPIMVNNNVEQKNVFCSSCIDFYARSLKKNPLDESPLTANWKVSERDEDIKLSSALVKCTYQYAGCNEVVPFNLLSTHNNSCSFRPKYEENVFIKDVLNGETCVDCSRKIQKDEIDWHNKSLCTSKYFKDKEIKHVVKEHIWEKKLLDIVDNSDLDVLLIEAEEDLKKYQASLSQYCYSGHYDENNSPLTFLKNAAAKYAMAIKLKDKQSDLHFKLGLILEEEYLINDLYGISNKKNIDEEFFSLSLGTSSITTEEEDIQALCQQYGIPKNAPLSQILKTIDTEYQHLKQSKQMDKAEYVQQLYAFKSKEALKSNNISPAISSEENTLGQAFLKYMDALTLNCDNVYYNLHVGRLMLLQGKNKEALQLFQQAVGLKPGLVISRFYLGLVQVTEQLLTKDTFRYLHDGIEFLIEKQHRNNWPKWNGLPLLNSENLWRLTNTDLLNGFLKLGKHLTENSFEKNLLSSKEVLHSTARMAAYGLHTLVSRNNTYHIFEKILFESHSSILNINLKSNMKEELLVKKCQNLSSLIKSSTLPKTSEILTLQEKICETGIYIQPCNSHLFYLLGDAQLSSFDNNLETEKESKKLTSAINSYRISIALEGKPLSTKDLPELLISQEWWQELNKKEKNKQAIKPGTHNVKDTKKEIIEKTNKKSIIATNKTGKRPPVANPQKGNVGQKNITRPGVKRKETSIKEKTPNISENLTKPLSTSNQTDSKEIKDTPGKMEVLPLNKTTYHSRLGLARALYKQDRLNKETCILYMDVIMMAPKLHDAYIELAEILIMNNEAIKAVDIYDKFPFSDCDSSFDDGYIHGEVVRILMKNEKFDDSKLETHSIALGKILGIGSLEKYVNILDSKMKCELLKRIYAGVNGRSIDDPEMQAFFKFKMWL